MNKSKIAIFFAAMVMAGAVFATPGNNGGGNGGCGVGQQTNGCGTDPTPGAGGSASSTGVGVGVGIGIAGSASNATGGNASNTNSNVAAGGAGGQGGNASATGGTGGNAQSAGGSATASATGAGASITYAPSTTYREAAQTAYAPNAQQPRTSCRIFIGLGGSSRDGSLSGGIPIGNDQSCLSGLQIELMDKVNAVKAGTFTAADYLAAACKVEGMSEMKACKP